MVNSASASWLSEPPIRPAAGWTVANSVPFIISFRWLSCGNRLGEKA